MKSKTTLNYYVRRAIGLALAIGLGLTAHAQQNAASTAGNAEDDEDYIELSPFEVDASNNQGYYSERTLAGSRIDTPLRDIAASISIVNREQLQDTSSTDINDVFLYDVNTESAQVYTPTITSFRDGLRDGGAGFSAANTGELSGYATSNRIRGLESPDNSRNFYRAIDQMGFDAYNTNSIEINRGPNSLLFGQGSAAGIVNQNTADANTSTRQTEIQFRVDDRGSYRAHFNHNQPIIEDVLGVYLAGLHDNERFEREPSYDDEQRLYGAVTFRPVDRITIRANYELYRNDQSRPNTLMPIDAVTPWIDGGRPSYDPITRMITVGGQTVGPYAFSEDSPYWVGGGVPANGNAVTNETLADGSPNPLYVPGIAFVGGRYITMIDSAASQFVTDTRMTGVTMNGQNPPYTESPPDVADRTDGDWALLDRNWMRSNTPPSQRSTIANWQPSTLTAANADIYDWTRFNTNSPNNGSFDGDTLNVELGAKVFDWWHLQAGMFRQTADIVENFTLGQLNANRLWVDPNVNLITGAPNPFYGQPFVEDSQGDTFARTIDNSTVRLQSVMTADFTDKDGILRWLGRNNFIAIASRENYDQTQQRIRAMVASGTQPYLPDRDFVTPTNNWRWWVRGGRVIRQYYMGEPGNIGQVTRSAPQFGQPSFGGPTESTALHYNWNTRAWENPDITWANYLSEATTFLKESTTDSITLAWNGSLLDDRLVPTIGWRRDEITNRLADAGGLAREDFVSPTDAGVVLIEPIYSNFQPDQVTEGDTWTYGATLDVFRNAEHEVSIFYNQSENFNPPDGVYVDFYGDRLPDPGGQGKDYGLSFGLWNNKLTARFTMFENTNQNAISSSGTAAIDRVSRMDSQVMMGWAEMIARIELGQQPLFTSDPATNPNPYEEIDSLDSRITNRVEQITGLPYDYFATRGGSLRATENNKAEGIEISLTWNPTPNLTFRANVARQETSFSEVGPEVDRWLAERMPVWESATSPLSNDENVWMRTNPGDREVDITNFMDAYGFQFFEGGGGIYAEDMDNGWVNSETWFELVAQGLINGYKAQQGRPVDTQREWRANVIGRYNFSEGLLKGAFVGGGVRYESKVAIGYYGVATDPANPTFLNSPDINRPIYDSANTYFDFWAGYKLGIYDNKASLLFQLNVRNAFEGGDIRPVGADFAGNLHTWRIIDPRQVFFTTTLRF